jgi:hypothetical protein
MHISSGGGAIVTMCRQLRATLAATMLALTLLSFGCSRQLGRQGPTGREESEDAPVVPLKVELLEAQVRKAGTGTLECQVKYKVANGIPTAGQPFSCEIDFKGADGKSVSTISFGEIDGVDMAKEGSFKDESKEGAGAISFVARIVQGRKPSSAKRGQGAAAARSAGGPYMKVSNELTGQVR